MARKRKSISRTGYWIFSAGPTAYDVESAITEYEVDSWPIGQSPVRKGDKALIWAGKSGTQPRSCVAIAQVLTDPESAFPLHEEFFSEGHLVTAEPRVLIRYLSDPSPESIYVGLAHFKLQDIEVSGTASRTIFPVRRAEWDRITRFIDEWEQEPANTPEGEIASGSYLPDQRSAAALDHALESLDTSIPLTIGQPMALDPENTNPIADSVAASRFSYPLEEEAGLAALRDERERTERQVVYRSGQRSFRQQLFDLFHGRCAITGCDVPQVLEAAHIIPYTGASSDVLSNGLLLREDVHTLFDRGLVGIDEESLKVVVSAVLQESVYAELAGRDLIASHAAKAAISRAALEHHRRLHALPKSYADVEVKS